MKTTLLLCCVLGCAMPFSAPLAAPQPREQSAPRPLGRTADGREYIRNEVKVTLRDAFAQELKQAAGRGRPLDHSRMHQLHAAIQSVKAGHSNGRAFLDGAEPPGHIRARAGEQVPRLARKLTFALHPNADAAAVLDELRALPQIESASLSEVLTPNFVPNDPSYPQQWAPPVIGLTNAWNVPSRGNIRVAIVDTGVDLQHPEFAGRIVIARGGFGDFPTGDAPTDGRTSYDHGTHVAGIVAAELNNGVGVAGFGNQIELVVMNCAIWKAGTGDYGIANSDDAINQAITDGARVINCSFGPDVPASLSLSMVEVLYEAYLHNVLVVCAAGNGGPDNMGDDLTGQYWDQIDVPFIISNLQLDNTLRPSSNFGWGIDLAAPGTGIYSTIPLTPAPPGGIPYGTKGGTSMAAPMVSGAAALIMSMNPARIEDHSAKHLLIRMATDIGLPGKDQQFGWGRLNLSEPVLRALRSADAFVSPVDNTGGENGDYDQPWHSLLAAFNSMPDHSVLVLNGGDVDAAIYRYPAMPITKPCTLTAIPDRPVVIGQP